ncbi:Kinesin-like protein kip2 [Ceratobasidium sp. UAMH 11750]|nr:Kinesin-like protein kip2 [Ceratobasidium sp. UAMH 11750]
MATPTKRDTTPRPSSAIPTRIKASSPLKKPIPAPKFTPVTPSRRPLSTIFGIPPTEADLGLVDWQNVQDADISGDLSLGDIPAEPGAVDKVLVSVRVKPSKAETEADKALQEAWFVNQEKNSLKLKEQFVRLGGPAAGEFHYDEILTGTDNKAVYAATAKSHVRAAMDGYNSVIFAYGQTASGKTFTLSGSEEEPGIIPRAMRDVFGYIKKHPDREFLLRASYLEIYNEQIHDLLAPPTNATPVSLQGAGDNVYLVGVREEPITSFKSVKDVLARGDAGRRTASTDWNERSSRSHSVFRLVIESRETVSEQERLATPEPVAVPMTPGGTRLQSRGGRSVQTSTLSLIDLAGSEKATSDKDRTREGKYINTSLLTLGSVIGTLAENSAKGKNDHVPFRNSKLTRMLQPSLSGDARISVICTLNPHPSAIAESTSTLQFAARVKKVSLHATKKEIVDTDALLEPALAQRPLLPTDAPDSEKDRLIADLSRTVRELEIVTRGYEDNLGAPLRQVREDVEKEWSVKLQEKERELEEKQAFIDECQRALEKEKKARLKLQEEKLALVSFVRDIDFLQQKSTTANYTPGGTDKPGKRAHSLDGNSSFTLSAKLSRSGQSLLADTSEVPEEDEIEDLLTVEVEPGSPPPKSTRSVLGQKENLPL